MTEKDNKYWQDRQEKKFLAGEKKVNQYYKELEKSFEQSKREIQKVINDFVMRYGVENESPSYATAMRKLNKTEIGDLQAFIDLANENMGKYNQELNNMSFKARITRYQALEKQIDATLQQLYALDYETKGEELLKELYADSYYQSWFNIDQYHGFHQEFAQINPLVVEELIKYPFNGADFSTRLWKQKDHMLQQLNESITTMLIQGKNPVTLSTDFAKKFNTKEFEAYRLLHSEGTFIMEQGTLEAYKEDGVEKYEFLATLDSKTSDKCINADGLKKKVTEAVVGVNYPPLHVFCRSTTTPYYEDSDYSDDTRVARDPVTGKSYEVPSDMKYPDWHKEYIESNPEAMIEEKKWKNRFVDKKQYDRYVEVLDKDTPKTLDDFQNLKYNNGQQWNKFQLSYKDQKIRNTIRSDETVKTIESGKQGKHIKGHNNYIKGRSYLTVTEHEAQDLVNKGVGTGKIQRDSKGTWMNQEIIDCKQMIGVSVDNISGNEKETSKVKIHYSKKGVHIVPYVDGR